MDTLKEKQVLEDLVEKGKLPGRAINPAAKHGGPAVTGKVL